MAHQQAESSYEPDKGAPHHLLGGGMLIQVPGTLSIPNTPGPNKRVAFRVEMVAGIMRPTSVAVSSDVLDEITAVDLRSVNVKTLWRSAIVRHITYSREDPDSRSGKASPSPINLPDEVLERMRLRGPVTETLDYVSDMYSLATTLGLAPALYVQEAFKGENLEPLPRTTATKWIKKARDRGILGDPLLGDGERKILRGAGFGGDDGND